MRVALLRHFPTDWNAEGRLQGRSDQPLSEESRATLRRLRLPSEWEESEMVSSPLGRAVETARALGGAQAPIATEPRLTEFDFGDWEGLRGKDLLADPASGYGPVEGWGLDFRPPGGESIAELTARVAEGLAAHAAPGRIFVVHRGVMRALMGLATGWRWLGPEPFRIKRAALHPLILDDDGRPAQVEPWRKLEPR